VRQRWAKYRVEIAPAIKTLELTPRKGKYGKNYDTTKIGKKPKPVVDAVEVASDRLDGEQANDPAKEFDDDSARL